ncbi:MAG: two component regulator three y domain-containing protein [Cyclobacteriaceae bacterium]|nr:two component regulator three y domain-containing protein [Cyclobacteriaceae bacterium SS2]
MKPIIKDNLRQSDQFKVVLYITLIMVAIPLFAQQASRSFSKIPVSTTFHTEDYNGGIQNWDITQDQRGFIYVANNFGLLEYDGRIWKNYTVDNNTRVRSVYVDEQNRVFIGGQNQFGYFQSDSHGNMTFTSLYDQLGGKASDLDDIWKIVRFKDMILFSSFKGLVIYDGQTVEKIDPEFGIGLVFNLADQLFVHSPEKGLLTWDGQNFNMIPGSEILRSDLISGIVPNNTGILIFQKNGNVFQYQSKVFSKWEIDYADFLKNAIVNMVTQLSNNNIAIATQNSGLIIISPEGKLIQHLTKDKGLNDRTVLTIYEDQFRNLWVGQNNGITMVELASPFSLINEQTGLPGTGYAAAYFQHKIYLGTSNGLYYQEENRNPLMMADRYQLVEGTNGQVYNIQQIGNDLLLAHHKGAYRVTGNKTQPIFTETGTWKYSRPDATSKLILGTYEGFRLIDSPVERNIWKIGDFAESSRVFEFINDTTLFMTHGYKGVYKLTLNSSYSDILSQQFYGAEKGFPSNILINVFRLGDQLVFPAETGIFTYDADSDKFLHHELLESYLGSDDHVRELAYDMRGNIYYYSVNGLGYLERINFGKYEKHEKPFNRIRKYLSDDFENITIIDHENVLFGAKEGFIHYNPSVQYQQDQTFKTYIREIVSVTDTVKTLYGGAYPFLPDGPNIPANFSSLKFSFSSPYFNGQEDLLYQYQLENFDQGWSEWSRVAEKEYTNLYEGDYVFNVRAKNAFNQISEPAIFQFTVFPPWYRSRVAYFIYFASIAFTFGVVLYTQNKRHKRQQKAMTIKQKRELLKKDNELEEVSKKSKEEITRLRNEKLRAEIDHKNRELATNTMHLINKNEFMLSLKESIQAVAKNGQDHKDSLKKIIKDIDRNLSEDDGWEQFTRHFDQVHGDFLTNIKNKHPKLTPQEIKLCAYLRMNMTSKEIANLLNISVRGVEISRYRLRKKLELDHDTNLVSYMLHFT